MLEGSFFSEMDFFRSSVFCFRSRAFDKMYLANIDSRKRQIISVLSEKAYEIELTLNVFFCFLEIIYPTNRKHGIVATLQNRIYRVWELGWGCRAPCCIAPTFNLLETSTNEHIIMPICKSLTNRCFRQRSMRCNGQKTTMSPLANRTACSFVQFFYPPLFAFTSSAGSPLPSCDSK